MANINKVVRMALSEIASTAAGAVNQTDAKIAAKVEAGEVMLADKGSVNISSICHDWSGSFYASDSVNDCIYKIDEGGRVSIFAGYPGINGDTLSVADARTARFDGPNCICSDKSGKIYIGDVNNYKIKVIHNGKVSTLAGTGIKGLLDGAGNVAQFNTISDLCVDRAGNVYVADLNCVRKITNDGTVLTIAGSKVEYVITGTVSPDLNGSYVSVGSRNGKPVFKNTTGSGYLWHDTTTYWIISATEGDLSGAIFGDDPGASPVSTSYGASGGAVGTATVALPAADSKENVQADNHTQIFGALRAIAVDQAGNVYVAEDGASKKIKKITPNGWVYLHSGSGAVGDSLGTSPYYSYTCEYSKPSALDVDESGNLYLLDISDTNGDRAIRLDFNGRPFVVANFKGTTLNLLLKDIVCTPGQKIMVVANGVEDNSSSSSESSASSDSSN